MAKKPRIGQPPKYVSRGGTVCRCFTMPKDLSQWLRDEAARRNMKMSAFVVEALEWYKLRNEGGDT